MMEVKRSYNISRYSKYNVAANSCNSLERVQREFLKQSKNLTKNYTTYSKTRKMYIRAMKRIPQKSQID